MCGIPLVKIEFWVVEVVGVTLVSQNCCCCDGGARMRPNRVTCAWVGPNWNKTGYLVRSYDDPSNDIKMCIPGCLIA